MPQFWYEKARRQMRVTGVTIRELADRLDMTPGGVGHYLSGRRQPTPGMLKKIAQEIGMSVSELIEDDPSFARDQYEHSVLEAIRKIPEAQRDAALAMLLGLASQGQQKDDKPTSG